MSIASLEKKPTSTNCIGFFRFFFALLVLYSHSYFLGAFGKEPLEHFSQGTLIAGTLAVQAFFVLSGYLITQSWIRNPHLISYLRNRLLRLVPALWACLVVTGLGFSTVLYFLQPTESMTLPSLWKEGVHYIYSNLISPRAIISTGPYPHQIPWPGDWNGSLWTLFYEAAAYLMIAGLGVLGFLGTKRWLGFSLLLAFITLSTCLQLFPSLASGLLARLYDTPGKQLIVYFAAGACWAMVPRFTQKYASSLWNLSTAALLLLALHLGHHEISGPWLLPPLLLWLAQILPLQNFENWVGGDYSYGLYLYGYPVQQLLASLGFISLGFTFWFLSSFIVTLFFATLSWHLIESPALSLKSSMRKAPSKSC
jgi:peptidoglycan/LPS O-acetylase OafA/YrhL